MVKVKKLIMIIEVWFEILALLFKAIWVWLNSDCSLSYAFNELAKKKKEEQDKEVKKLKKELREEFKKNEEEYNKILSKGREKYKGLAPDSTIDIFYNKIKKAIDEGTSYKAWVRNLKKVNGEIPKHIQDLIDSKK